ncbi:Protein kinase domain [Trypanosoma vivax]|nr:mitogen-activated protein kinase 5 [Trypanosoma vivax]KAH8614092.1 Protein kinase domain [Trypanosoma vivax]
MVSGNDSSNNNVRLLGMQRGWKKYQVRDQEFEVESRYTLTSVVGYGAYGVVCAAFDNTEFRDVAIKRIAHVFEDLIDGRRIWREIVIQRLLREHGCRNILNLSRVVPPKEEVSKFHDLYIVSDLYDTDLHATIHRSKGLKIDALKQVLVRILRCVADMHKMGIIHRDLKPSNVLLREESRHDTAVVCDFGLARAGLLDMPEPLDLTDYVVTRWYRPPELLLMSRYSLPIDLWAVGCIMGEFVLKRPLFGGRDYIHQMQLVVSSVPVKCTGFVQSRGPGVVSFVNDIVKVFQGKRPLAQTLNILPRDGLDLITRLLAFEPSERLTAVEALRHPFLADAGGEGESSCVRPGRLDISFDLHVEISETQLRHLMWSEISLYRQKEALEGKQG